jgi:hypothetical protein
VKLVGLWTVTAKLDRAGSPDHKISALRLGSELTGFAACGEYLGAWNADPSGGFVASVDGGSNACIQQDPSSITGPSWLRDATSYRLDGADVQLFDIQHHVIARLTPRAKVASRPDMADELTVPPTPDATLRNRLKAAVVPSGSGGSIAMSQVVGHWLPSPVRHYPAGQPYLSFSADGSWKGLDGCNGVGGRWRLEPDGALLTTNGPSTLIGCEGVSVGSWVARARNLRLYNGALQLYDVSGHLIGTLVRG